MLRPASLILAALLAATCAGPASAGPPGALAREPGAGGRPGPEAKPTPPASLDDLFARLRDAEDDAEAKGVARLIERRFERSGSATADLVTERARLAMSSDDLPLAAELMDRATNLEPGWAEGWKRRALVFWHLSDKAAAIADLQRALVLEPRHFEAWAALGRVYQSLEDKPHALDAFRRAAALYPRMEKVKELIERLRPDVDGREL
ncbi:tetratricopeptide repeat protein [Methylobacterium sp. A54F]